MTVGSPKMWVLLEQLATSLGVGDDPYLQYDINEAGIRESRQAIAELISRDGFPFAVVREFLEGLASRLNVGYDAALKQAIREAVESQSVGAHRKGDPTHEEHDEEKA